MSVSVAVISATRAPTSEMPIQWPEIGHTWGQRRDGGPALRRIPGRRPDSSARPAPNSCRGGIHPARPAPNSCRGTGQVRRASLRPTALCSHPPARTAPARAGSWLPPPHDTALGRAFRLAFRDPILHRLSRQVLPLRPPAGWTVSRRFATGRGPYNLAVSPDGRYLVATLKQGERSMFSTWRRG